jgi:hypothetical protein
MTTHDPELAAMDRLDLARFVKGSATDQLSQIMRGEGRAALLDRIFADMPGVFRSERAGSTRAVVHWQIGDRADGGTDTYEIVINDGVCDVSERPERTARLALTIGAVDFLRMVTGNANPTVLFFRGRMKATGDLGLAMKFPAMFDLPKV